MRPSRVILVFAAIGALTLVVIPAALAAFGSHTENSNNLIKAAPDFVAPAVTAVAIGKTQGGLTGAVKTGGTYYVYAQVEPDGGAPPSGTAGVTANAVNFTSGAGAVALTAGTYTSGGLSFDYRSAALTNSLSEGTKSFTVTATDNAGNAASKTGSASVDNVAPTGADVQTTNLSTGTPGFPEAGDKLILTYSEVIDPESIIAGWNSGTKSVVVRFNDNGILGTGLDSVTVYDSKNQTQVPLGTVELGRTDYATGLLGGSLRFSGSTMQMNGAKVELTLGTYEATILVGPFRGTAAAAAKMVWTPSTTPFDSAGNPVAAGAVNESGALDLDF